MNHEYFMQLAIDQGKLAKGSGEWPFGAVVVLNEKVISQNRCQEAAEKTVLAHAELQAVNDACKTLGKTNLSDCTIYCTNEPCLMCASAIIQAKISTIVIGASRSDLSRLLRERKIHLSDLAKDAGYQVEITEGVLKNQVLELFKEIEKK